MKAILKYFILIIYISLPLSAIFSQDTVLNGRIIDKETQKYIDYVNIGIQNIPRGTVSNENGLFQLRANSSKDSIIFSSIGYKTQIIAASYLTKDSIIELTPINYSMPLIEVKAERFGLEDKILGTKNETRGPSVGFGSQQLGAAIGALINIDKKTYIKSANFVLNHASGDSILFRMNIYQFKKGKVGQTILTENIYIIAQQKRGILEVDLRPYNLILDNPVLLALEWIKDDDGKGNIGITFDSKKSKKEWGGFYLKHTSIGNFYKNKYKPRYKPCFYFVGKQVKK